MIRSDVILIGASWFVLMLASCRAPSNSRNDCVTITHAPPCPWDIIEPKNVSPPVSVEFQAVPDHHSIAALVLDPAIGEHVEIDLGECVYLACLHSPLARLLESQRRAIQCRSDANNGNRGLNQVLCAQEQQQRTQSAADAADVFLRLVEVELQRDLIDESRERMAEYHRALDLAEETGFATADARNEVNSQQLQLDQRESELDVGKQKMLLRLNAMIGMNPPQRLRPVYPLVPEYIPFDVEEEVSIAYCNRPDLKAIRKLAGGGCEDDHSLNALAMLEPRLTLPAAPSAVKMILCRQSRNDDFTQQVRARQAQQLLEARQQQVRLQVLEKILDIQASFEKIALASARFEQLTNESMQIKGQSELDGLDAYVAEAKNWAAIQKVKSERISAAIEFEVGKIRLLELQGCLLESCRSCYD